MNALSNTYKSTAISSMVACMAPKPKSIATTSKLSELVEALLDIVDEDDEGAWQSDWLQFCREDLRLADDPSDLKTDEEREDWVTDGVRRFCKSRNFLVKIKSSEVPS